MTGLGFGLVLAPLAESALGAARGGAEAVGAASLTIARTVGMLVGLASLTAWGVAAFDRRVAELPVPLPQRGQSDAVYDRLVDAYEAQVEAAAVFVFGRLFLVAAILCALAAVASLWLQRADAANWNTPERADRPRPGAPSRPGRRGPARSQLVFDSPFVPGRAARGLRARQAAVQLVGAASSEGCRGRFRWRGVGAVAARGRLNRDALRSRWIAAAAAGSVVLVVAAVAGFADSGTAAQQVKPGIRPCRRSRARRRKGRRSPLARAPWTGTQPITFTYRWRRCDTAGLKCGNIGGATQTTYMLKKADVGETIRIQVTARNSDGSTVATSAQTAVVQSSTPAPGAGCAGNAPLQIAGISPPDHLVVDGQSINPNPVGRGPKSVTVRFHVSCKGKAVQGALVYATAVP